jgi:hypothetical protein
VRRIAVSIPRPFGEKTMTNVVPGFKPGFLRWPAFFGLVLFGSVVPRSAWSQTPNSPTALFVNAKVNPFAGFETHYLSNGLKVWFKQLPEAPNVSISVGISGRSQKKPKDFERDPFEEVMDTSD